MPTRLLSLLLLATALAATGAIVVALAQGAATRRDAALDNARTQQMAPAAGTPGSPRRPRSAGNTREW